MDEFAHSSHNLPSVCLAFSDGTMHEGDPSRHQHLEMAILSLKIYKKHFFIN